MRNPVRAALVAAAVVIGAGGAVAASSPAYAAFAYVITQHQGGDHGIFNPIDNVGQVCDSEADGNGVRGEFVTTGGTVTTVRDGNGSAAGCGSQTLSSSTYRFRVCEEAGTSSATCSAYVQWNNTKVAELTGNSWAAFITGGSLEVCDGNSDAQTVYGNYVNAAGTTTTVTDTNGASSGCGTRSGFYPVRFQVCKRNDITTTVACGDWVNLS
jgi:hypothetical protein